MKFLKHKVFFCLFLFCSNLVFSSDIAFDFLEEKSITGKEEKDSDQEAVEAFAKFAEISDKLMQDGSLGDDDAEKLIRIVQIDPNGKLPLAMLMAYWLEKNEPQKLIDCISPIAKKAPHSDSLALASALAYARLGKQDESIKMIESTLDAIEDLENYEYGRNYVELVIHLGELYSKKGDLAKGEKLYDSAVAKPSVRDNFKFRRSAFIFFSQKAERRDFSLFSGYMERRFYSKMMDHFEHIEQIWLDELTSSPLKDEDSDKISDDIRTIELAPIVEICQKFGLVERIENLIIEKLIDDPKNIEAKLVLATVFQDMGNFASSRRLWRELSDKFKSNFRFFEQYGRAAIESRKYDEAVRAFEWAEFISSPRQKEIASYMTAIAYMNAGMNEKAISKFASLKRMPEAFYSKAICLRKIGEDQKAADSIDEAEKLALEQSNESFLSKDFYFYAAYVNDRARRHDRTIEILKKVNNLYPDDHEICNFLGYTLANLDRELALAEELLKKALTLEPENAAYLDSMAWLYYRKKDFHKAYEYIDKSIKNLKDGPDAVVYDHAGDICDAIGKREEALQYWRTASEIFSEDSDVPKILEKIRKAEERM
ncbi:MAG TPA: hypothetical protein PK821_01365 [Victivallales bacterium]|nr:hypothetical protein [Victivallales bacterium]